MADRCPYCQGFRSPCTCTADCGTHASPVGPCPESDAGRELIAAYRREQEEADHA